MRKLGLMLLALWGSLYTPQAQAVEVGDIYYHDGTFSNTFTSDKMAVGLVYWVSARKDYGFIMALNQPDDMTYGNAEAYCQSYQVLGIPKGTWHVPNRMELLHMGKEQWNGTANDKFTQLNAKLATITGIGESLKSGSMYWARSQSRYRFKLDAYGVDTQSGASATGAVRCVMIF